MNNEQARARSYCTLVFLKWGGKGGWNGPISACLHHNPPHSADVMQMHSVKKAQPQNCALSFTAEDGEKARGTDNVIARGSLMKHPEKFKAPWIIHSFLIAV